MIEDKRNREIEDESRSSDQDVEIVDAVNDY